MNEIQELESKLTKAKIQEKLNYENKEMQECIDLYVGKCYGSRAFRQKVKHVHNKAIYITDIRRLTEHTNGAAEGTVLLTYSFVNYHKGPDWRGFTVFSANYSRGTSNIVLNDDKYNMSHHIFNLTNKLKEISVEKFKELYICGDEIEANIELTFSKKLDITIEKTCGDSTNQTVLEEKYKKLDIPVIDLEKYPELLYTLRYSKLPGFFEDRFLFKDYAKKALLLEIDYKHKDMNNTWCSGSRYEALLQECMIIENHIELLNL